MQNYKIPFPVRDDGTVYDPSTDSFELSDEQKELLFSLINKMALRGTSIVDDRLNKTPVNAAKNVEFAEKHPGIADIGDMKKLALFLYVMSMEKGTLKKVVPNMTADMLKEEHGNHEKLMFVFHVDPTVYGITGNRKERKKIYVKVHFSQDRKYGHLVLHVDSLHQ